MMFGMRSTGIKADAGSLRGTWREAACQCWFTSTGRMMPLMLKLRDEDGQIRRVDHIAVHSQEKKNYAGVPSVEFDCTLFLPEGQLRARLIYLAAEGRWAVKL